MRYLLRHCLVLVLLAGCATTAEPVWAPQAEVTRAAYVHAAPPSVTLITVINNRSGEGGHTAVLVNGAQRVMWDPAGTWYNPAAPERNDLHYGITPRIEEIYIDYHARETWRVVAQDMPVTQAEADRLIALFQAHGAVPKAQCTTSTVSVLQQIPRFAGAPATWFPRRLMDYFAGLPGVTTSVTYDDDDDNNQPLLRQQIAAGQDALASATP